MINKKKQSIPLPSCCKGQSTAHLGAWGVPHHRGTRGARSGRPPPPRHQHLQMRKSRASQKWVAGDPKHRTAQTEAAGTARPEKQAQHWTCDQYQAGLPFPPAAKHPANGSSNPRTGKHIPGLIKKVEVRG